MGKLKLLFFLWGMFYSLLGITASEISLKNWIGEDSSGKFKMTKVDDCLDIVSPDGLTLWYDECLTGNYEISYRIKVLMEGGKYDRLSDMNCFWGAKDLKYPDNIYARKDWRAGIFKNYNTLNLFYVGYGGNENKTTRFREYHSEFYGIDENKIKPLVKEYTDEAHLLKPNRWYEVVITVTDGKTTFAVDGEELFCHSISRGQGDGYFAIRLWKNHVQVSDFVVRKAESQFAYSNYRRYYQEARCHAGGEKKDAVKKLREYFSQHPYRAVKSIDASQAIQMASLLGKDGRFSDLNSTEEQFERENAYQQGYENTTDDRVGIFIAGALNRIYQLADACRKGRLEKTSELTDKLWKAVVHYGNLEISRPNDKPRFHASCFAIPTAAVNIYFACTEDMDRAERGEGNKYLKNACDMLKVLGLQAYTQPLRRDETDKNVVSVERFRNHVWWVGGNALAYRSLLPVAVMYSSVPMLDVLTEVCQRGISMTSQITYDDSFWTEGFTADGAGWGHGMQCLIWGYPIDGTSSALNMLGMLNGTPWAKQLSRENADALMNFFRGGSWYYRDGYRLPCLDRNSYEYRDKEEAIPYYKMLRNVVKNWLSSFSPEEQKELQQLLAEAETNRIRMKGTEKGVYQGTRWFFNNDDLMKHTPDYHLMINMASVRCDGLESAAFADNYNFYPTDGMTLFQRHGNEYFQIMGGWDVTASPGVTAREGMERLTPVTNWRGYCSRHNFAAGAADGADYAAGGYIFEKMHGADKENVNDKGDRKVKNELLYGFKAYKGYFVLGDYLVALGAGVTNNCPDMEGHIRTTLDQTARVAPVYLWKKGKKTDVAEGSMLLDARKMKDTWVIQEGQFAYQGLPEYQANLYVASESRPAHWAKMNARNKKKSGLPEKVSVLRLWTDHGQSPKNDTYGYTVYLGKDEPARKLPFEVLRNDTLIQAVRSTDKKVVEAVFYPEAPVLKAKGLTLEVSAPCALVLRETDTECYVSVTDARMDATLKEITLVWNGQKIVVPMPQGISCGKSVTVCVKK